MDILKALFQGMVFSFLFVLKKLPIHYYSTNWKLHLLPLKVPGGLNRSFKRFVFGWKTLKVSGKPGRGILYKDAAHIMERIRLKRWRIKKKAKALKELELGV